MKSSNSLSNYIAVIDCNNFFVSCERVFRPDLEGKPVIVLSSNDGCVVARSQEVKDMAIPMGAPVFEIKDIIKDKQITLFSSNFALYRDFSRRVFEVVKAGFAQFEQYSIDEAFISLNNLSKSKAIEKMVELRTKIHRFTGIPVSVGIGGTKTQAKYASKCAKKEGSGVFVCDELWWLKNAREVSISDIWGVGRQLRVRYQTNGITNVEELRNAPTTRLEALGGVVSVRLQYELNGQVIDQVSSTYKLPKSIISSRSFGSPVKVKSVLLSALSHHLHKVVKDLEEKKLVAGNIAIYMEEKRAGRAFRKYETLPLPILVSTRNISHLLHLLLLKVDEKFNPKAVYRKVGVFAGALVPESYVNKTLFPEIEINSLIATKDVAGQVHNLMYELQSKYGEKRLTVGTNTTKVSWQSKKELCSPSYTTDWLQLQTARA